MRRMLLGKLNELTPHVKGVDYSEKTLQELATIDMGLHAAGETWTMGTYGYRNQLAMLGLLIEKGGVSLEDIARHTGLGSRDQDEREFVERQMGTYLNSRLKAAGHKKHIVGEKNEGWAYTDLPEMTAAPSSRSHHHDRSEVFTSQTER